MKKPKGPELKMPELKAPAFLADLFYDLRDRRLLPLVALVLVAIAAVPFLLGGNVEEPSLPASGAAATALESPTEKTSKLTVVEATPGLRDYRKRLRDRTPTDPFKQRYTGLPKAAQVQSTGAGSSGAESSPGGGSSGSVAQTGEVAETVPGPSSGGGGSSGGSSKGGGSSNGSGGAGAKPHLVLFDYAIDARISRSEESGDKSQTQQDEPVVKYRVLPQTPLPGEKAPVVTYIGPGRKEGDKTTGKVLLLVSGEVRSIGGKYHCISRGGDACQLLEVEPGTPLSFAYGDNGVHYTIKVLKIELVVTGHT